MLDEVSISRNWVDIKRVGIKPVVSSWSERVRRVMDDDAAAVDDDNDDDDDDDDGRPCFIRYISS